MNRLHLPDLAVEGFRGIDSLHLPVLGRVTLLAGGNGIGKTAVLEAVRVYAARARHRSLIDLLHGRGEFIIVEGEDGDGLVMPDWSALFHNRDASAGARIAIGPMAQGPQLVITPCPAGDTPTGAFGSVDGDVRFQSLSAEFGDGPDRTSWTISLGAHPSAISHRAPMRRHLAVPQAGYMEDGEPPPSIACELMGPGLLSDDDLARLWDSVALTEGESRAVEALRTIYGSDLERVAVVGDHLASRRAGRRAVVKLRGQARPVPLRSLGDGAMRMFGAALALSSSRGGFLLIDDAGSGIHHSLQSAYWGMVLRTAVANDVQVIASTHSWDCIRGFAQAAQSLPQAEGMLLRISRRGGMLRAVEYPADELRIAAEQRIEVR